MPRVRSGSLKKGKVLASPIKVSFAAGDTGAWRIERIIPVTGETLAVADHLHVHYDRVSVSNPVWVLGGVTSNGRYTTRAESDALASTQEGLGRPKATQATLIPIRKTEAWWALAQDERRAIMEERSRHIAIGMDYLPAIARRLHHSRDLGEPFDFLTWFEYAPEHAAAFDDLVRRLRNTEEWCYVDREVDIRLVRTGYGISST
jgi:chlorite dismutase